MVERHRERFLLPVGDATDLAPMRLQSAAEQAQLEVMAIDLASLDEIGVDRSRCGSGFEKPDSYRTVPGLRTEAEPPRAFPYRVPLVVIPLNGRPVVATRESRIRS